MASIKKINSDTQSKTQPKTQSKTQPKTQPKTQSKTQPKTQSKTQPKNPLKSRVFKSTFYDNLLNDKYLDLYSDKSDQKKKYKKEFEEYLKKKEKEKKEKERKKKLQHLFEHGKYKIDDFKIDDFKNRFKIDDFYKHILDKKHKQLPKKSINYNKKIQEELQKEIEHIESEDKQAFIKLEQLVNNYLQEWLHIAPSTIEEALEVAKTCGEPCFLKPSTGEYGVCPKCGPAGCYCAPMCSGLYNANLLAQRKGDQHTLLLARKLALEFGCDWALLLNAYLIHKYPNALKKIV